MPTLLFSLTNVPEDEAQEVRQLLRDHALDIYETTSGRWRTGVAAIWLNNEHQYEQARALLDNYQAQRAQQARDAYEQQRRNGADSVSQSILRQPVRWLIVGVAVAVIVGLMVVPFIGFLS